MKIDQVRVEIDKSACVSEKVQFRGVGSIIVNAYAILEDFILLDTGSNPLSTIEIGTRTKIKHGAVLGTYDGYIKIGNRTSIGEYSVLAGHGGLKIGDCVIIAGHCYFSAANHIFSSNIPIRFQGETAKGINISDNCWIGALCCVLDGVKVGANTVIGAGSVVTESLPDNSLCKGIPCKRDRLIISDSTIREKKGEKYVCTG